MGRRGLRVTAAALALAAVVTGAAGCGSAKAKSASDGATPASSKTKPVPAAQLQSFLDHCPPVVSEIAWPPNGKIPNPDKVVAVRMCNGEEDFTAPDGSDYDILPPADEVTSGIGALVQIVNGSEPVTDSKCFQDQGPNLVFWFRYADNTARAVVDERYDCRPLLVGPDQPTNAGDELYLGYLKALAAQRAGSPLPKGSQPTPDCDITQATTPVNLTTGLQLTAAVFCTDQGAGKTGSVTLSADQVSKVHEDFAASTSRGTVACGGPPRWLAGTTVFGDHVLLKGVAGTCSFAVPNVIAQESGYFWTPSAPVESLLERLTPPAS